MAQRQHLLIKARILVMRSMQAVLGNAWQLKAAPGRQSWQSKKSRHTLVHRNPGHTTMQLCSQCVTHSKVQESLVKPCKCVSVMAGHTQRCRRFRQHGQLTLRVEVWDHAALLGQVNSLVCHHPQPHEGSCPDLILSLRSILPCLFS